MTFAEAMTYDIGFLHYLYFKMMREMKAKKKITETQGNMVKDMIKNSKQFQEDRHNEFIGIQ